MGSRRGKDQMARKYRELPHFPQVHAGSPVSPVHWGNAASSVPPEHRESSTFPCIGDAVMPAAWPLAYCPPDAFALPAVGTQGMANRPSPEEGTQAFLRKARWWVSGANPDEVEVWRVAEEKTGRRGSMGILRVKDQAKSKYRDTPRERPGEVEVWGCTA